MSQSAAAIGGRGCSDFDARLQQVCNSESDGHRGRLLNSLQTTSHSDHDDLS